jgi:hypothetical protein
LSFVVSSAPSGKCLESISMKPWSLLSIPFPVHPTIWHYISWQLRAS